MCKNVIQCLDRNKTSQLLFEFDRKILVRVLNFDFVGKVKRKTQYDRKWSGLTCYVTQLSLFFRASPEIQNPKQIKLLPVYVGYVPSGLVEQIWSNTQ